MLNAREHANYLFRNFIDEGKGITLNEEITNVNNRIVFQQNLVNKIEAEEVERLTHERNYLNALNLYKKKLIEQQELEEQALD